MPKSPRRKKRRGSSHKPTAGTAFSAVPISIRKGCMAERKGGKVTMPFGDGTFVGELSSALEHGKVAALNLKVTC